MLYCKMCSTEVGYGYDFIPLYYIDGKNDPFCDIFSKKFLNFTKKVKFFAKMREKHNLR